MVNLSFTSGLDTLTRAQDLLNRTASNIARNGPSPADSVNLIRAKADFSAGTKVIKTQDQLTQKLLDIFV